MIGKHLPVLMWILLLPACAISTHQPMPQSAMQTNLEDEALAWRTCYFHITWDGDIPRWEVDPLLAHRIAAPVLNEHGNDIHRWRFHRRALRDEAGHLFRFHFYTDTTIASSVVNQIENNADLSRLLDSNILESATCSNPEDLSRPGISDTSDPNWPDTVQRHWPAYIMGISIMWLGLIDDAISGSAIDESNIDQLLEQYRVANEKVTDIWHVEAEHAFLHHLSVVFGYADIHVRF